MLVHALPKAAIWTLSVLGVWIFAVQLDRHALGLPLFQESLFVRPPPYAPAPPPQKSPRLIPLADPTSDLCPTCLFVASEEKKPEVLGYELGSFNYSIISRPSKSSMPNPTQTVKYPEGAPDESVDLPDTGSILKGIWDFWHQVLWKTMETWRGLETILSGLVMIATVAWTLREKSIWSTRYKNIQMKCTGLENLAKDLHQQNEDQAAALLTYKELALDQHYKIQELHTDIRDQLGEAEGYRVLIEELQEEKARDTEARLKLGADWTLEEIVARLETQEDMLRYQEAQIDGLGSLKNKLENELASIKSEAFATLTSQNPKHRYPSVNPTVVNLLNTLDFPPPQPLSETKMRARPHFHQRIDPIMYIPPPVTKRGGTSVSKTPPPRHRSVTPESTRSERDKDGEPHVCELGSSTPNSGGSGSNGKQSDRCSG